MYLLSNNLYNNAASYYYHHLTADQMKTQRFWSLLRITQQVSGETRIQTHICLVTKAMVLFNSQDRGHRRRNQSEGWDGGQSPVGAQVQEKAALPRGHVPFPLLFLHANATHSLAGKWSQLLPRCKVKSPDTKIATITMVKIIFTSTLRNS